MFRAACKREDLTPFQKTSKLSKPSSNKTTELDPLATGHRSPPWAGPSLLRIHRAQAPELAGLLRQAGALESPPGPCTCQGESCIGLLFGGFGRHIRFCFCRNKMVVLAEISRAIPGLPGGLIIYQGHLWVKG